MSATAAIELSSEQRLEVAAWIEANSASLPPCVRDFLALHQRYLSVPGDPRRALDAAVRELRRALHITPSSEKRRSSGAPLANLPATENGAGPSEREVLEGQIARGDQLADWHRDLKKRHRKKVKRLKEKLAKMPIDKTTPTATEETSPEDTVTDEDRADNRAHAQQFVAHLQAGSGSDLSMQSVNETLMPGGAVLVSEERVQLAAEVPEGLAEAKLVKTMSESRVRYDFSVSMTRIELEVEKKILVDEAGERHVIAASTLEYGPPRYAVTWDALATLTVLVAQFAMPFNRLGTLLSTPEKKFTAGALSRMLHYVAERLLPIYLELARQLANSEVLAGDDTSCRVLEVSRHFAKPAAERKAPPWSGYQTPKAAERSILASKTAKAERVERRAAGDREATPTPAETPSLGVKLGLKLPFESARRNGDGAKESMHVSVISGRSVAADPLSLIVFYRSHLGSCGNLFEVLLGIRDPQLRQVTLQGDMSTSNLVTKSELLTRFAILQIGCAAHARRPFAVYQDEDPERCEYMLHLFLGLAIHEQQLDVFGRNRDNVLAVRTNESRELWNDILELAQEMKDIWSKSTKLGAGARYIIKHFDALTAYLDDPHLEPTNNLRERMLRMEKLIEGSAMFRRSLEGRFVLDVVRTLLQTAVAAGVPVHAYLVSVLRASDADIAKSPDRFTPHAWAAANRAPATP